MTTTPCSASSPAPTWRAVSTPAIRPGCARTCRSAAERGVRIGAQVSYRDLAGFGRRFIDVAAERPDRRRDLSDRRAAGARPRRRIRGVATSNPMARCTTRSSPTASRRARSREAVHAGRPGAAGAGPGRFGVLRRGRSGSACARSPRHSPTAPTGRTASWFPAAKPGAVLHDPAAIAERVVDHGAQRAGSPPSTASSIACSVESVCVHGDSPGAVQIATAVRDRLTARRRRIGGVRLMRLKLGRPDIANYRTGSTCPPPTRTPRCR